MHWLCVLCIVLLIIIAVLAVKIYLMHKALDEIIRGLSERLETDTNTLISISSRDWHMRSLASELNAQLRLLRRERRRLQSGDVELHEAVANISHDLRTPLTAIRGYLDLMKKEKTPENAERYLSIIENRVESLTQLTEELFRYSVIVSAENELIPENVCLNSALEESLSAYYGALKAAGITPCIAMPEEKIFRSLNLAALSRIFGNVISNAIKYSGGDLYIDLSPSGEIIFTNTAPALSEVQVGKLFDRFYTVEDGKKSTGLGLSIARALTEQMNGSISSAYTGGRLSIRILFPAAE